MRKSEKQCININQTNINKEPEVINMNQILELKIKITKMSNSPEGSTKVSKLKDRTSEFIDSEKQKDEWRKLNTA